MRRISLAVIVTVGIVGLAAIVAAASPRGAGPDPAAPGDRQNVTAPIDRVEVVMRESNPVQVSLKVTAGLPSGCAKQGSHSVSRAGEVVTVTVLNTMPAGNPICTTIYGQYDLSIDLGSSFAPGTTYTVRVNDKTVTFKT